MENPAAWGPVEHAINKAHEQWQKNMDAGVAGLSLAMMAANELRRQGLVKETDD